MHFALLAFSMATMNPSHDWLLGHHSPSVSVDMADQTISLSNGLISRSWLKDSGACFSFLEQTRKNEFLRAVKPEATVTLGGNRYDIGGLSGTPDQAYIDLGLLSRASPAPGSFQLASYKVMPYEPLISDPHSPTGKGISFEYRNAAVPGIIVTVRYQMPTSVPVVSKWIEIKNDRSVPVTLNHFQNEVLAAVEGESNVDPSPNWRLPNMFVTSDYTFGGMSTYSQMKGVHWVDDPTYTTQVNYDLKTPCLLVGEPQLGPDIDIAAGQTFKSYRVHELLYDSTDRERNGLAVRKLYRTLAPWSQDNPLMLHLTSTDPATVHTAIDQAAACGFEMIILSFGSGVNMETTNPAEIQKFKEFADYAHSKGLRLGGYSLLASRRIDDENDVINPKTGKTGGAIFGNSPCLLSQWGIDYFHRIQNFLTKTGFDLLEHDGSYPGDLCASTSHPGHKGLDDSQYKQWLEITDFYQWCRSKNIYLNVPDNYFLSGSNKTGMGYRETNWSLPRALQHVHCRQNLYDGTWEKTPSMGWTFVPLVQYQGGGAAATIEPLKEHLADYEMHLANNLGYGAQACYRGPRLYDSPETEAMVKKWVGWFKKYREVLESDVIHLRRCDGRSWDGILHANPTGSHEKGMLVLYNSTNKPIHEEIEVPIYYTGLLDQVVLAEHDGKPQKIKVSRGFTIPVTINIPAKGMTWFTLR
ncbi:MAG: alpha-galactosidase [Armatimonadetes bacterium]|nr:alpha-galactosidase [Armatimonadota bacterium]